MSVGNVYINMQEVVLSLVLCGYYFLNKSKQIYSLIGNTPCDYLCLDKSEGMYSFCSRSRYPIMQSFVVPMYGSQLKGHLLDIHGNTYIVLLGEIRSPIFFTNWMVKCLDHN